MNLSIMEKLAVLVACSNSFFASNGLGSMDDEYFEILNKMKKEYQSDETFREVVDSNKHLLTDRTLSFLKKKAIA